MFLVLEFLDYNLEDVINDRRLHLTEADRKAYMKMLLEGLDAIHQSWVLHRVPLLIHSLSLLSSALNVYMCMSTGFETRKFNVEC